MLFSQFLLAPFKQILVLTNDFSLTIIIFNRSGVGGIPCRLAVVVLFCAHRNIFIKRMFSEITKPVQSRP